MSVHRVLINKDVIRDVEQFLYREARLLDTRDFQGWLNLLTEDIRYWMPVMSRRYPISSKAISVLDGTGCAENEFSEEGGLAILDETKESLARRISRMDTGMAWAEDPPSRTCHLISNVEVYEGDKKSELIVFSNFILYRTRSETEQDFYVGSREDCIRSVQGELKISSRKIILPQNVLSAKNVSNFF